MVGTYSEMTAMVVNIVLLNLQANELFHTKRVSKLKSYGSITVLTKLNLHYNLLLKALDGSLQPLPYIELIINTKWTINQE